MSDEKEMYEPLPEEAPEIQDPIAAKREALRNGRANRAGENFGGNTAALERADGAGIQALQREGGRNERIDEIAQNNGRGTDKKPGRVGRADRRPGKNHGPADDAVSENAAEHAAVGGLKLEGAIPERIESEFAPEAISKKRSRSRKQAGAPEPKKGIGLFKNSVTLSKQEAEALAEPLIAALIDDFGYLDEFIWWYCQDKEHVPIWGDIDREEAETLARVLLKRGQRSPGTAATVRAIVNGSDYLSALIITVPRIIRTVDRVRKAPKRVRPSRRERLAMARGAHHEHQA